MKSELESLVGLQKKDTRIRQLKEDIETATERRARLEEEFDKHASSIRDVQKSRDDARSKRAELDAHIAEAKTSLERASRNLTTATDQKQYEAAMREIDVINKQISQFETETLENMDAAQAAEKILEERSEEVENLESDWEKQQAEFDGQLENDKKEFANLASERQSVFGDLTPKLAAIYDRLATRSRDGIAVAKIVDGACSACFMALRKQIIVNLKTTDDIIICESCTRILYIANEEQSEATAS